MKAELTDLAKDRRIWTQLAIFVAITAVAVSTGMAFEKELTDYLPETKTLPSALNDKPSGYSGASELAEKLGLKVHHWQEPYRRLTTLSGTLVIISPSKSPAPYESTQILDWVKKGNNLIYLDNFDFTFQRRVLSPLGIDSKSGTELTDSRVPVSQKDSTNPLLRHVDHIMATATNRLTGGTPLVSDRSGPLIVATKYGDGQVIVSSIPSLCSNRRFGNSDNWDNFQFLMNFLSTTRGDIYFDEFSHGFSSGHNVFVFLSKGPVGLVFAQFLLLLILGVLAAAQRFGATKAVPVRRKASNLEFISGMANAYQRARATDLAWQIISHSFLTRIARSIGLSAKEPPEVIAQSLSASTGAGMTELQKLLEKPHISNGGKPSKEELLELVATCDKITDRLKTGSAR
jgi:hypothetical protein